LFLENKGEVLITNLGTNNINRFDIETGAYLSGFANGISGPTRTKSTPMAYMSYNGLELV